MKEDHVSNLLPEYLDNALNKEDTEMVAQHLAECLQCKLELDEMKILFKAFEDDTISVPTDRLSSNFEVALEAEKSKTLKVIPLTAKSKKSNWASNVFKVAAGIALLIASFQTGGILQQSKIDKDLVFLKNESLQMKQTAMLSLMENQSASKRIQGVGFIEEFDDPDEAIVKALGNRLLYDENDNVRLNAFEALSRFSNSEHVKQVLIEALETEKNPSIQIGIIQVLVKIQEKKAIAPMQKLLEQEDTQPFVKKEINLGIPKII
ncbi:MAG: HEAT repeat domain-containing protein [Flavobacteriaceae bacterium]